MNRRLDLMSDGELYRIAADDVLLLPIGSVEPHGPLPLGTDRFIPEAILARVAKRVPGVWLFPAIPVGHNFKYDSWPGSIGVSEAVLAEIVRSAARGAAAIGLRRLFVMSGHDENREAVLAGLRLANRDHGVIGVYCDWLDLGWSLAKSLSSSRREGHGSELQTSVLLHLGFSPALPAQVPEPEPLATGADDLFAQEEAGVWVAPVPRGAGGQSFTGDPRAATAEKGALLAERIVSRACEIVAALRRAPLDPPGR
jgi:creatinine amidohydrolase